MTHNIKTTADLNAHLENGRTVDFDFQMMVDLFNEQSTMTHITHCSLCGEPMPEGETMFKYHGYSGPCPKPPLKKVELDPAGEPKLELTVLEREAIRTLNIIKAATDGEIVLLPTEIRMAVDAVLLMASVRRVGVR